MADKEVAPLSEQRLQEIRERAEKATKGPWDASAKLSGSENHRGWSLFAVPSGSDPYRWLGDISPVCGEDGEPSNEGQANIALIVNARQDIPDLLAELTRSRAALLEMGTRNMDEYAAERFRREKAEAFAKDSDSGKWGRMKVAENDADNLRAELKTVRAKAVEMVEAAEAESAKLRAALLEVERQRDELLIRVRGLEEK